jgi:hypothetical protein
MASLECLLHKTGIENPFQSREAGPAALDGVSSRQ